MTAREAMQRAINSMLNIVENDSVNVDWSLRVKAARVVDGMAQTMHYWDKEAADKEEAEKFKQ